MFEFWFKSKSWNLWALSVNFFWLSPNNGLSFRAAPLAGNFRLASWWKILGWSLRRKNSLRVRILHCQYQVLEESENQTCKSKTEVYDCAIKTVFWNVNNWWTLWWNKSKLSWFGTKWSWVSRHYPY